MKHKASGNRNLNSGVYSGDPMSRLNGSINNHLLGLEFELHSLKRDCEMITKYPAKLFVDKLRKYVKKKGLEEVKQLKVDGE